MEIARCSWPKGDDLMIEYHDKEWGTPVYDDRKLFEFLILESAQAGLSWRTILHRRDGYREAYKDFDISKVAKFTEVDAEALKNEVGIVRNRLKIKSSITCARLALGLQKEFGSLSNYFRSFVGGNPVVGHWKELGDIPITTDLSDALSKDMKTRGFSFVGSTIMYSFLQATGMVNDHTTSCFRYHELVNSR